MLVIENSAEYNFILSMIQANYSAYKGFFVDASRGRYGGAYQESAYRGGPIVPAPFLAGTNCATWSTTPFYSGPCNKFQYYNSQYYMNVTGGLVDIFEGSTINGGYICKKFWTANYPTRIGYNIGTCYPTASCPGGWSSFTPNSQTFCYYPLGSYVGVVEENFRECHQLGADMIYPESTSEVSWLTSNGYYITATWYYQVNAHSYRYGPANTSTWSNGAVLESPQFGWQFAPGQFDYTCGMEWCAQIFTSSTGYNDIFCGIAEISWAGYSACKRPLCSNIINSLIQILFAEPGLYYKQILKLYRLVYE